MLIFKFGLSDVHHNYKGNVVKLKGPNFDLVLTVIAKRLMNKKVELKNGFVDVPTLFFKKAYDSNAAYLDYLVKNNIVRRRPYSTENHECFGYKFIDGYIRNLNLHGIIYYDKDKINNRKSSENDFEIDKHLINKLKRDFFSVKLDLTNVEKTCYEGTNFIDSGKWFRNIYELYKWSKGKEYRTFNLSSNRIYTNFTSLSSVLRKKNVLLDNDTLVEFDISNSFPKMLALFCKTVNPDIIFNHDYIQYCTFVKNGMFYDILKDKLNTTINCNNNHGISNRLLNRKAVKQLFQIFLNGNLSRPPYLKGYSNSFIREQFEMLFPSVSNEITKAKLNGEKIYFKLVAIETQFILNLIADLYEKFPKIKILTVHDSISIPKSFKLEVSEVWDTHMKDLLLELPDDFDKYPSTPNLLEDFEMYEEEDTVLLGSNNGYLGRIKEEDFDFLFEDDTDEDW
jgi:hypothetical protein